MIVSLSSDKYETLIGTNRLLRSLMEKNVINVVNFNMILVPHHTKNRRTRVEVSQSSSDEQARSQL